MSRQDYIALYHDQHFTLLVTYRSSNTLSRHMEWNFRFFCMHHPFILLQNKYINVSQVEIVQHNTFTSVTWNFHITISFTEMRFLYSEMSSAFIGAHSPPIIININITVRISKQNVTRAHQVLFRILCGDFQEH